MTPEKLLEAIGDIDDAFIEGSVSRRRKFFGGNWGLVASAACLCLLIGGVIFLHNAGWMPYFPGPTQNTEPPVTTTDPTIVTDPTEATVPGIRPSVEELFSDRNSWHNNALTMIFPEPSELSVAALFKRTYDGKPVELTKLEQEGLKELLDGAGNGKVARFTADQIDEILQLCFGLTAAQMGQDFWNCFTYLEETGCYYQLYWGSVGSWVSIARVEECDDGTLLMYYAPVRDADAEPDRVARLQPHDTGYYILSNEYYKDNSGKTEEQIAMENLLGDYQSWYNRALACEYAKPEELELYRFFYCGFPDESQKPTAEEWEQLKDKQGFNENYDLIRLPEYKMDQVLQDYFGITLEDIPAEGFSGMTYLESTDCWYFMITGYYGVERPQVLAVETLENGTVHVRYEADYWGVVDLMLQPNGDGYRILSNQKMQ